MKPYLNPEDQEDQLEEDPEDIPTERTQQPQTREEISGSITRSRALRLRMIYKTAIGCNVAIGQHLVRKGRRGGVGAVAEAKFLGVGPETLCSFPGRRRCPHGVDRKGRTLYFCHERRVPRSEVDGIPLILQQVLRLVRAAFLNRLRGPSGEERLGIRGKGHMHSRALLPEWEQQTAIEFAQEENQARDDIIHKRSELGLSTIRKPPSYDWLVIR
ncbi:hypothetical protein LAZ67_X003372 [Cordylochernes scorpioides]|uniref:Uncharacterized protein n=1 Tax=Cordylochernes scorpioides TaxID=51811 RepID=A0ABY6LY86_9ARAC|nr:hypothetical protein LAZ67_X003372 [Cordylochernes scorpioides]